MAKSFFRGDIYYADLGKGIGSEQEGYRPVVIVQNNVGNKHSPTVIVAPVTTNHAAKAKVAHPLLYRRRKRTGLFLCDLAGAASYHR